MTLLSLFEIIHLNFQKVRAIDHSMFKNGEKNHPALRFYYPIIRNPIMNLHERYIRIILCFLLSGKNICIL